MKLPTTPAEMLAWAERECRRADRTEKIVIPILWIFAILVLGMFFHMDYLSWMGKLPKP